jgi:dTDP-glucose 4,6-dehydratase
MGYASDLSSIERLGAKTAERHHLLHVELADAAAHGGGCAGDRSRSGAVLGGRSHVDRSIDGHSAFIESNVTGTFKLLQTVRSQWQSHPTERQSGFRLHHISTDEVFGSLGATGRLSETTPYAPRSPIRPTKPPAITLVSAWDHTYGMPGWAWDWSARKAPSSPGLTVQSIRRYPAPGRPPP